MLQEQIAPHRIEFLENIVAMRTDDRLAEPRLLHAGICQITREIVTISRRELAPIFRRSR
jgi:hypothetical protein